MGQDKLEGKELYYSLNGHFGAWAGLVEAIDAGLVKDLKELRDLAIIRLEDIHLKMKKMDGELDGDV